MTVISFDQFRKSRHSKEEKVEDRNCLEPRDYVNRGSVVFIGFHPDDLDFHAAGLAATLTAAGVNVIYVVVTSGEKNGHVRIREQEQRQAAGAVGVKHVTFLRRPDGGLAKEYRKGRLQKLMNNVIHFLRPYAIVTFCPANLTSASFGVEHPDHRYGALAVWEAIYPSARQEFHFAWWKFWREPLPGHHVREVLWFGDPLVGPYEANCHIDVGDRRLEMNRAIAAHESQWDKFDMFARVTERCRLSAKRWGYEGMAEEYYRIVIPE